MSPSLTMVTVWLHWVLWQRVSGVRYAIHDAADSSGFQKFEKVLAIGGSDELVVIPHDLQAEDANKSSSRGDLSHPADARGGGAHGRPQGSGGGGRPRARGSKGSGRSEGGSGPRSSEIGHSGGGRGRAAGNSEHGPRGSATGRGRGDSVGVHDSPPRSRGPSSDGSDGARPPRPASGKDVDLPPRPTRGDKNEDSNDEEEHPLAKGTVKSFGFKGCIPTRCSDIDRSTMKTMSVSDTDNLHTGDVLLISGFARGSMRIREFTQSFYSHSGMIVRDLPARAWEKYGKLRNGQRVPQDSGVYFFDSDFEEDGSIDGPSVRPLKGVLEMYSHSGYFGPGVNIVVRKLHIPDAKRAQIENKIWDSMIKVHGKKYTAQNMANPDFRKLILASRGLNKKEGDGEKFFCSELLAHTYFAGGLIDLEKAGAKKAINYMPQDFATPNGKDKWKQIDLNTILLMGASLLEEVRIDLNEIVGGSSNNAPKRKSQGPAKEPQEKKAKGLSAAREKMKNAREKKKDKA